MDREALVAAVSEPLRLQTVLLVGFCAPILLLGVVLLAVGGSETPAADPMLRRVLTGVAVLLALVAFVARRVLLSPARLRRLAGSLPTLEELAGVPGGGVDAGRLELLRGAPAGVVELRGLMLRAQPMLIALMALNESVAMVGFVLAFLAGDPLLYLPFAAIALVLQLALLPSASAWIARARIAFPQHPWPA